MGYICERFGNSLRERKPEMFSNYIKLYEQNNQKPVAVFRSNAFCYLCFCAGNNLFPER